MSPLMAKTYIIQAEGMMCQACVETITDGFNKIYESPDVNIDLETQKITVTIDDNDTLDQKTAESLIKERGYQFISISN